MIGATNRVWLGLFLPFERRRRGPENSLGLGGTCSFWVMLAIASRVLAVAADESMAGGFPAAGAELLQAGERIVLDGRLDEAAWSRAMVAGDFRQSQPAEGAAATESTEVRIVYNANFLYVGAWLHDSEPARILARQRARDGDLGADDGFAVVLDTFGDGRTGYLFETNPAGVLSDALLGDDGPNESWDGVWDVRTSRTADGWYAEFAVPFRTLNFDPAQGNWAVNFRRTLRRANEESLWSGHRRSQGLMRTLYAGRVTGLTGLSQGRGLEFKPYVAARRTHLAGREAETETDLGFDFTYSITPKLRAALTVNTDFADTEVDERELNLGRFPVRFPEKRDFFLEGSSVFAFPADDDVSPYYSRRVGLSRDGPVPIGWGLRLAGQAGPFEIGTLHLRTKAAFGRDAEDFTVWRTRASVAEDSYVGLLYTRRAGHEPRDRHTVGMDADVRVADFGDGRTIGVRPYAVWTSRTADDDFSSGRDRALFGFNAAGEWGQGEARAGWHETGEAYDPAVGFAFDTGYRAMTVGGEFDYLPGGTLIQEIDHDFDFARRTNLRGELIESDADIGVVDVQWASGDVVGFKLEWGAERLDEPFDIWEDVVVPAGRYDGWGWSIQLETAEKRWWAAELGLARGAFLDGTHTLYATDFVLRPLAGVVFALGTEQRDVQLAGGNFTTREWRGRFNWSFTTRHALQVFGQYDNESDAIGLQARLRWILRPGAEFFLGYLHDWAETNDEGSGARRWRTLGRQSAIKGSYTSWF